MAGYKKIMWSAADVRCPFYTSDSRAERCINCEGYSEGMELSNKFKSLERKDRHMGLYCVGRFEQCPVYKCVYGAKYADD